MRIQEIRDGVRRLIRLPLRTREQIDADADAELETFIAERVDSLIERGATPADARREALERLGLPLHETAQILHHSARSRERRMNMRELMDDFSQDVRYTFRTLRRDARFSLFAIVIVGLGIGASTTVFSVANAMLIRPLPFREPERLAWMPNQAGDGMSGSTVQVSSMQNLMRNNNSFEAIGAYFPFNAANDTKLLENKQTVRLNSIPVTYNFFDVLGVRPFIGRGFNAEESTGKGARTVMLSYSTWKQRYNGARDMVGKSLILNNTATTVIGVLPESFDFGSVFSPGMRVDFFTPFPMTTETDNWGNTLAMVGRLKKGATVAQARTEMTVLAARMLAEKPRMNTFKPTATSLRDHVSGNVKASLLMLVLSVAVVMLIVCANLSNLLLARATTRQKEMAVRVALGAGKMRLVRQMLTESIALSIAGAVLGLAFAWVGTRVIATAPGMNLPLLSEVRIDGAAIALTALLAIVAGLAFGLVPALQIPSHAVHGALKDSSRSATGGNRGKVARNSLVVSEIALACMLLVGAGLLSRSFLKVLDIDMGFKAESVSSMRADPSSDNLKSQEKFVAYIDEILRIARETPGVSGAATTDGLPLGNNRTWGAAAKENGAFPKTEDKWFQTYVHIVSDGYAGTLQIPIKSGRDFTAHDGPKSDPVIIINETLARKLWPDQDAIGKSMSAGGAERRVIGVVADVRHLALEKGAGAEMYIPIRQTGDFSSTELVLRSRGNTNAVTAAVRTALAPVSPEIPANQITVLQERVDTSVSPRRFMTLLLAGFAGFALLLALLGIYGVISYTVNHRVQEIGVRMALGATARQLQLRIIRETLVLAAIGMVIGTILSWALARTLGGLLFGVSAADPITFIGMLVVLTIVALASGYLPARRASRIDPMSALRGS